MLSDGHKGAALCKPIFNLGKLLFYGLYCTLNPCSLLFDGIHRIMSNAQRLMCS